MYAAPLRPVLSQDDKFLSEHLSDNSKAPSIIPVPTKPLDATVIPPPAPFLREGTFRESNISIGYAAERKGVKVREFDRGDRWLAWRKRQLRVKRGMLARAAKASRKQKGKKSNKGIKSTQKKK
jgi:hypothetical protein